MGEGSFISLIITPEILGSNMIIIYLNCHLLTINVVAFFDYANFLCLIFSMRSYH